MTTPKEQTQDDLKPCPFCGEKPDVHPSGNGTGIMIECLTNGCVGPHTSYYGEGVAQRVWNTRALTGSSDARDAELVNAAKGVADVLYLAATEGNLTVDGRRQLKRINAALSKYRVPPTDAEADKG